MLWTLRRLLQHTVQTEIASGVWVSARPLNGPFTYRLRAAWAVLTGKADAFTWPTADPHSSQKYFPDLIL